MRELLSELASRLGPIDLRSQDTLISRDHVMVIHDAMFRRRAATHKLAGGFLFDVRAGKVLKVFSFTIDLYALDEALLTADELGGPLGSTS